MDNHVLNLLEKLEKQKDISDIGLWNVSWNVGMFLHQLVLLHQPKNILEIGTSNGFSGTWMASAADTYGGILHTIESSPKRIPLATKTFEESKLSNIHFINGHAPEVFPDFGNLKFDMVFIDATKHQYLGFYEALKPYFADKVLLLADNVLSHPEPVQDYLDVVRKENLSTCLEIGTGVEMTIIGS